MRVLSLAAVLLVAGCTPSGPAARPRPPPLVTAQVVTTEDVPQLVRAPIDVRPVSQADITSKSVGVLDAVLVDRGDPVRKGQVLAVVHPSDIPDQVAAARGAVAQASSALALAESTLERARALHPQGLVSDQELQAATAGVATARAQAQAARAQLGAVSTRLGETRLESPLDGVVTARRLDPGALVSPTAGAVLSVARIDEVRVFVAAPERTAGGLAVGQPARLEVAAFPGEVFTGEVTRLAPAFDPLTRTLDAEVHIPNVGLRLRPGMYGAATVQVGLRRDRPVVPVEAVQLTAGRAHVFVVDGEVTTRRAVELGEDLGDRLEIRSGLSGGELIVVAGIDSVSDGARVRVARPDGGAGAPERL